MLTLLIVIAIFGIALGAERSKNLSITINKDGTWKLEEDKLDSTADIEAMYVEGMNSTGWDILEVKINVIKRAYTVTDNQRMFAAGLAEGYLTSLGIYQTYKNIENTSLWDFTRGPPKNLQKFMDDQASYMNEQINKNKNDPFWQYADLLREQLSGLQYGYNLSAPLYYIPTYFDSWPFVFLNLVGDLLDLMSALS